MAKIIGHGAPTKNTCGVLGQEYFDKDTNKVYTCTKVTHKTAYRAGEADAEYEWAIIGGGGITASHANSLWAMLQKTAFATQLTSAEISAFKTAWGIDGTVEPDIPAEVSNEVKWTDGVSYTYEEILNEYIERDGTLTPYTGWDRTPYLYCDGASTLRFTVVNTTTMLGQNNDYNVFFDADKNFIQKFSIHGIDGSTIGSYVEVTVPANAVYFIASHKGGIFSNRGLGRYVEITPYE